MFKGKSLRGMTLAFLALAMVLTIAGCKRPPVVSTPRPAEPTPTAATGPAPALTLSVSPGTIEKGQSATLTWNANNAQTVVIEPLGTVTTSGSRTVTPESSTTYSGKASAPNRSAAEATARLTVTTVTDPPDGTPVRSGVGDGTTPIGDLQDINFEYDRYDIRSEDQSKLRNNAEVIKRKYASAAIVIQGHCDERGTEEYNQALGDRRATVTKEALVRLGVPATRLNTVSFGESKPVDLAKTEAAFAKNRRAHFERQ